jgi:hypothetical protein
MDKKTQSLFVTSGFQNYMLKKYLHVQLSGMIQVFRGRYPDYITADQMMDELKMLDNLIHNMDIKFIIPSTATGSTTTATATTTATTIQTQVGQSPGSSQKTVSAPKIVMDADRCHARVWDAGHLVWKLGDGRQVYGSQCKKAKMPGGGFYCKKHAKKLTHEDWFKEPSDTMRLHFTRAVTH